MSTPSAKAGVFTSDGTDEAMEYWKRALVNRKSSLMQSTGAGERDKLAACERWDRELDAIRSLLVDASAVRNAHCPAASLPEELLISIFDRLTPEPSPYSGHWDDTWMNFSFVCHRWRSVALNCPSLWTIIEVNKVGRSPEVDTMLARAKRAPLDVIGDLYSNDNGDIRRVIDFVREHMHRIRYLAILGEVQMDTLVQSLDSPAPELRELVLRDTDNEPPEERFSSLPNSFIASMSNIRTINLLGVSFPWPVNLKSITKLELASFRVNTSVTNANVDYTFSKVLLSLKHMTHLTSLHLTEVIPDPTSNDEIIDVQLPRLRSLFLSGTFDAILLLWKTLLIPSRSSQSLWFINASVQNIEDFRLEFKKRCLDSADVALSDLDIGAETIDDPMSFSFSTPLFRGSKIISHPNPQGLSVMFHHPEEPEALHNFCYDYVLSTPLRQLAYLTLKAPDRDYTFDQVMSVFDQAQSLEYVHLLWTMTSLAFFLATIVPPAHRLRSQLVMSIPKEHRTDARLRLPKLETLYLGEFIGNFGINGKEFGEELALILQWRKEAGVTIRKFRVQNGFIRDTTMEMLRRLTFVEEYSGDFVEEYVDADLISEIDFPID